MRKHSTRRLLAGLGVAAALVTTAAAPVAAAPEPADVRPAVEFGLYANSVLLAPGGPAKHVTLTALADRPLPEFTVTVDRSGVDGFAEVTVPTADCTADGAVLTCTVNNEEEPVMSLLHLAVTLRPDAGAGQRGELAFTVAERGGGRAGYRSTVAVGEGVDLVSPAQVALSGRPGATVPAPLTVTNQGEQAVGQLVLYVVGNYGLAPATRYRNCEYATGGPHHSTPVMFACTFERTLAPGETVRVDTGFGFALPGDSWAPNTQHGSALWLTPADWAALRSQHAPVDRIGENGTDGVLGLGPVTRSQQRERAAGDPQSDVDPEDNATAITITVQGDQRADAVAAGARVDTSVGRTVPVTVGFTNAGPAALATWGTRGFYTMVDVAVPEGTTAVRASEHCRTDDDQGEEPGRPGGRRYTCYLPGVLRVGERAEFPFSLRVDTAGRHTSTVELLHLGVADEFARDLDPSNDTATIVVDTTGPDGGDDGDGGDGGGLPITGAPVATIAGVGLALVVVGAVIFLVTRRRGTGG
ncbi:cell wall anchor protein [Micromonospora fluostatini]|uniref:cell wall anchor protein n=1 Tax=Micromonospora sp. JCM 30529 TaxID=3421643 RepID=UPI003D181283